MAGHSKFKNIQHRKGAQDKKRSKIFTRLIKEISVASKIGGNDPETNPRLRTAIIAARSANLPKDRIDRVISGDDSSNDKNLEEIQYEGFIPGGIAVIVEAFSDNRNRTASEVRYAFSKAGGNLGENGSVSFMFDRLGTIEYCLEDIENIESYQNDIIEYAIEIGSQDVVLNEKKCLIYTDVSNYHFVINAMEQKFGAPNESGIKWIPQNIIEVDSEEKKEKITKFVELLEESEDISNIFMNCDTQYFE